MAVCAFWAPQAPTTSTKAKSIKVYSRVLLSCPNADFESGASFALKCCALDSSLASKVASCKHAIKHGPSLLELLRHLSLNPTTDGRLQEINERTGAYNYQTIS